MATQDQWAPRVEDYSIDEAFLDLTGMEMATSLEAFGQQIRQIINQWIGITVCVGIAPTKTLAKLANHAAKQYRATGGVVDLTSPARQHKLLALMPVNEVWGIGRKITQRLDTMGIRTALALSQTDPKLIRRHFSVVVERTVLELNGESCLDLEEAPPTKKEIVCSRSFGERITTIAAMREAIATYISRAAEKLRGEGQYAKAVTVFLRTSAFNTQDPFYNNSATSTLPLPTNDTRDLLAKAQSLLDHLWKDGYRYAKAGVMLSDFYATGVCQPSLFDTSAPRHNSKALMGVLDSINHSGKANVWFAGQGVQKAWAMKRDQLSPAYTTRWSDLPRVQ
jgi:DNA polymerase V